jgi:hypothetical protein
MLAAAPRSAGSCRSIRRARQPAGMWLIHLACSDDDCTEELELVAAELEEAERVGCDCGHSFVWLSVSEAELV